MTMKPITGAAAAALTFALAACSGGGSSSTAKDQEFLQLTAQDGLSAVDSATRVELGHQMCDLLKRHQGNAAAAESDMALGALTPSLVASMRADATVAYCPKYR